MRRALVLLYALLIGGMLLGCQAVGGEKPLRSLPVISLQSLSQCGVSDPGLGWVRQLSELSVLPETLRLPVDRLTLDFTQHSLLVVYLGAQPNTGYRLQRLASEAPLLVGRLQVEVERITPKPGMMYAQMITSPCLLLEIPKGDYSQIEVLDQHGVSLGIVSH